MRFFAPEVVGVRLHDVAGKVIVQLTVPSETMIVPVGVPLPGAVTLTPAVTAIAALTVDGSGVCAVIAAVVVALLTVTLPLPAPLDALGANAGAPAYAAVTAYGFAFTGSAGPRLHDPVATSATGAPSVATHALPPALTATVPVGPTAPESAVTVTVTAIVCP